MNEEAAEQIVDRLKDEGDLIRNSGTNSIRSVKIQLDRFEDVFNVISENLITQTAMLAKSLDIQSGEFELAKETATKEETAKQFEDLEAKQDQIELKKPESKKDKEKEGKGLFSLLSGMGIGKLLMGGALIGGGLFVAYNLAKGFVDEMYGNAWTNFEEGLVSTIQGVDWASISQNFTSITTTLQDIATSLATLLGMIMGFIENPWGLIGLGIGFGTASAVTRSLLSRILGGGAAGGAAASGGVSAILRSLLGFAVRAAPPTALAAGILSPSDLGDGTISGTAAANLAERGITSPSESMLNSDRERYNRLLENYQSQLEAEIERLGEEMSAATEEWVAEMDAARTLEEEESLRILREERTAREERRRQAADVETAQGLIENQGLSIFGMNLRSTNLADMAASFGEEVAEAFSRTLSYRANPYNVDTALEMLRRRALGDGELRPEDVEFLRLLREAVGNREYRTGTKVSKTLETPPLLFSTAEKL
jgi:hypothetical protein